MRPAPDDFGRSPAAAGVTRELSWRPRRLHKTVSEDLVKLVPYTMGNFILFALEAAGISFDTSRARRESFWTGHAGKNKTRDPDLGKAN